MEWNEFPKKLTSQKKVAWNSSVTVVMDFLGNHKVDNYKELVEALVKNYCTMVCTISLKDHIFDADLDNFKENMGAYSKEQGERFHQDIQNSITSLPRTYVTQGLKTPRLSLPRY